MKCAKGKKFKPDRSNITNAFAFTKVSYAMLTLIFTLLSFSLIGEIVVSLHYTPKRDKLMVYILKDLL